MYQFKVTHFHSLDTGVKFQLKGTYSMFISFTGNKNVLYPLIYPYIVILLLFPLTSTSTVLCLFEATSDFLFIVSEKCHPHLQCAKPIVCAQKCHIPVCQRTCWELSHVKSASYGVWECQFEGPHYSLRGHVKMEHLVIFPLLSSCQKQLWN